MTWALRPSLACLALLWTACSHGASATGLAGAGVTARGDLGSQGTLLVEPFPESPIVAGAGVGAVGIWAKGYEPGTATSTVVSFDLSLREHGAGLFAQESAGLGVATCSTDYCGSVIASFVLRAGIERPITEFGDFLAFGQVVLPRFGTNADWTPYFGVGVGLRLDSTRRWTHR